MTETSPAANTPGASRAGRRNAPRDNLFAATMLVPVIAVFGIAGGKLILRSGGLFPAVVGEARAQQGAAPPAAPAVPTSAPPAAQPAATAPPPAAGESAAAVTVLLEQANYWRNQSQYDQALESLNRALSLDPGNKDALALSGQIQADRGNRAAAENALARLRAAAPDDPRIGKIDQTLRVGPIAQDALADARRLAREGHQAEAIDRYNRVFRGNPPPDSYSVEYYQTLAGTEGGWEQARDGLARTVRQNPQDLRAQLAYAQILTYRDGSRAEGITRLAALARNPAVADQATQAWRQALGWLPDNSTALDPLTVYLRAHPNDPDIANKLEQARNPTPNANDPSAADRNAGFTALNAGRLGEAAQDFQKALDRNANDADATGGLGIVRLRQHNLTEAKSLLSRAIALNPDQRTHWQTALDGANKGLAAAASAASGGGGGNLAAPAQALLNRGDYAGAERELLRAIATGRDNSGGLQAMLADSQAQQGRLGDAEGSYREALARNPRNIGALTGLAGVLSREGRSDEAQGLLSQAEALGGGRQVGQARAVMLREQAQNITDPATQAGLYREALASDPSNPWLRLDYARALVRLRQLPQARSVMGEIVGRGASNDALKAAIIFANETNDPDAARALIARLPPSARTPDMRVLQADSGLQREIGAALEASPQFARERLLQMAAAPDPTGARGAAIARALGRLGDKAAARDAIVVAQSASPGQGAAARLAYAGAFLDNGDPASARRMLGQIDPARGLSADQRGEYARLIAGLAVRTADQLNEQGKHADAYDRLAPALAQAPDNPDLNMALARIYQGNNNPREALEINQALLRRDPANQDVRRAAISAALQAGDRGLADTLVREGLEMAPNDPRMWMSSADVAKAAGNAGRALRDLQHARELRLQQLGYTDNGADASTLPGVSLVPGSPANYGRAAPRPVLVPASPWAARAAGRGDADGGADDSTLPWYSGGGSPPAAPAAGGPAVPLTASAPAPTPLAPAAPARPNDPAPPVSLAPRNAREQTAGGAPPANSYPYGRVLDTTPTTLPPPRAGGAQYAQSADDLNAQEVNGFRGQPAPAVQAPAYEAPAAYQAPSYQAQSVTPAYQPPAYQAPAYQAPAYQAPAYQAPAYQPGYRAPSYQAPSYQAPGYPAVPAAAPYAPPQPPVPQQFLYQSQQQQFLPQYQPYQGPPPAPPLPPIPPTPAPAPGSQQYGAPSILNDTGRNGLGGYYSNPFRAAPSSVPPSDQGIPGATPLAQPDPETAEIDRSILQLRDQVAPTIQGGFGFRERSGDSGLDQLTELDAPIEAEASPGGFGRLKLTVTPTYLQSGSIAGDATNLQRFGTSVFDLAPGTSATNFVNTYTGTVPKSQFAQGVGASASYNLRYFTADIGTTPLGFPLTSLVGGVEVAPKLTDNLTLRLTGERRAMTDSILSYAGTTDTRSGLRWGGEDRIRGHGNLEWGVGNNGGYIYAGAGAGNVTGTHVLSNSEIEAGAGGSFPVYTTPTQQLRVGLDLVYFGYKRNLRYFTLGQGGYFSPQSYAAALIPVVWKEQYNDDLTYEVGAAAGFQSYHENLSNYFPDDPALQAQLVSQQANTRTAVPGVQTAYPADSKSGFSGNAHAVVDYRVSPSLHLGLRAAVQKAGNYTEASGVGYARYIFNGTSGQ